jgi:hypothetical protein
LTQDQRYRTAYDALVAASSDHFGFYKGPASSFFIYFSYIESLSYSSKRFNSSLGSLSKYNFAVPK